MAVTTTKTNKPINPRGNDQSPKGYNRAALYSGKALDFDGVNDTLSTDYAPSSNIQTTAYWVKLDSLTTNYALGGFVKGTTDQFGLYYWGGETNKNFGFNTWNADSYGIILPDFVDDWFHIVAEYNFTDFTQSKLFVNGQELSISQTKATTLQRTTASRAFKIDSPSASTQKMNGQINGVKVFEGSLTAAQVSDLYNNPEKIVPTGVEDTALKLWLPMQEGAGTTAYDGSSTENGPDLIVNGDFATDSDWTKGTGWTISGGVATHDSSLGPGDLYQEFNLTIGKSYKITIEITATDTTELYFMTDSGDYVEVSGSPIGVHSHVFVADDSLHRVGVRGSGNWDGSVDNITLEELNFANHGTISGATYVNGVGSPVSQTAVIDWNKGGNLISYSEEFDQWNSNGLSAITADDTTSPNGLLNADKITEDTSTSYHRWYQQIVSGTELGSNQSYTISGFVKYIDRQYVSIGLSDNSAYNGLVNFDLINGTIGGEYSYNGSTISNKTITSVGNDWWKFSVTITSPTWAGGSIYAIAFLQEDSSASTGGYLGQSKSVHVWGWNAYKSTYTTPYIPTIGTTQPTPVLLPQGLTSGRDITGVNLFENVRKQGALNLDGNSWAEVHDNASLDITSAITLEAWVYWDGTTGKGILGRWDTANNKRSFLLYTGTPSRVRFYVSSDGAANINQQNNTDISNGWNHVVGVYDGAKIYTYLNGVVDGSQNYTSDIYANDVVVEIGRYALNSANAYNNDIAQPRIYNRALTAEEVLRNYNSGKSTYQ